MFPSDLMAVWFSWFQWLRESVLPLLPHWDLAHSICREAEFLHRGVRRVTPLCQQEFLVLNRWKQGWMRCPGVPILLMHRTSKTVLVNHKCWQPGGQLDSKYCSCWWYEAGSSVVSGSFLVSDFHVVFVNGQRKQVVLFSTTCFDLVLSNNLFMLAVLVFSWNCERKIMSLIVGFNLVLKMPV